MQTWQQLQETVLGDALTAEQKVAILERLRRDLERRVDLVEALVEAVRQQEDRRLGEQQAQP